MYHCQEEQSNSKQPYVINNSTHTLDGKYSVRKQISISGSQDVIMILTNSQSMKYFITVYSLAAGTPLLPIVNLSFASYPDRHKHEIEFKSNRKKY